MEYTHVALFENAAGHLADMRSCTHLALWSKKACVQGTEGWEADRTIPFTLAACSQLDAMRTRIRLLGRDLPAGTIIAGTSIGGVLYEELNRMGFCLCELDTFHAEVLDALVAEVMVSMRKEPAVPKEPVPTESEGVYRINLMEVQAAYPEISSKKALRPFLASTPFLELEIICAHMPPWLEQHIREQSLTCARSHQKDGTLRLRLSHAFCGAVSR